MKNSSFILLALLALALTARADITTSPGTTAATQLEAQQGTINNKFISPLTLGGLSTMGLGSPNLKSNQIQFIAYGQTNNTFSTQWTPATTNGFGMSHTSVQNGFATNDNSGNGVINYYMNFAPGSYGRFILTFTVSGSPLGVSDRLVLGGDTNVQGNANDLNKEFGFGIPTASGNSFGGYHFPVVLSEHVPPWGTKSFTNGSYVAGMWSDPTYVGWFVLPDGTANYTNIVLERAPWSSLPTMNWTNFCVFHSGTGIQMGPLGGRFNGTQTILNRTGTEGRCNYPIWTTDGHQTPGESFTDDMLLIMPPQACETNLPDVAFIVHGNTATAFSFIDLVQLTYPGTNDNRMNFCNALLTNNIALASYTGDFGQPGVKDTWGNSNSITCLQTLVTEVRKRMPFRYMFLILESAGGQTGYNFAAMHTEKIAGVIPMFAVYSSSNTWAMNINRANMNTAFGGSTQGQLATTTNANGVISGDSSGLDVRAFAETPILCIDSTGDQTVTLTNQSDLLLQRLGCPTVTSNSTAQFTTAISGITKAEISGFRVNGNAGDHGGRCFTPEVIAQVLAFINRCRAAANADSTSINQDTTVRANLTVTGNLNLSNNVVLGTNLPDWTPPLPGSVKLVWSNYVWFGVSPLKTNPVFIGQ